MCVRLTEQQHAGVGGSQTVGGEAGVVSKVLLCHVGKQQQRARLLVLDPQGVVVLHRPARQRREKRERNGVIFFLESNIKESNLTSGDLHQSSPSLCTSHLQHQYYLPLIVKNH